MIKYFKDEPNQYVIRYKTGQVTNHREGLDFWTMPFNASIAVKDTDSQDSQFIFNEPTGTISVANKKAPIVSQQHLSNSEPNNE